MISSKHLPHAMLGAMLIFVSGLLQAGTPQIGSYLTHVNIASAGEVLVNEDTHFSYTKWDSNQLKGKIRTIQHLAGRSKAKTINDPFIQALKEAKLDNSVYQTTTIINLDEAIFGTQNIVIGKIKKNKRRHPHASFILDEHGSVKASWNLKPKGSAIIVLDEAGKVMYFKDGQLNQQEVNELMTTLKIETARLSTQKRTASLDASR